MAIDAEYHRNYRLRVKERKRQQQQAFEDIVMGDKPATTNLQPLDYLLSIMNNELEDPERRMRAAISAAKYIHAPATPETEAETKGVKAMRQRAADLAATGTYSPAPTPLRLITKE